MPTQTNKYSSDFQNFLELVETALVQAAEDARELAERTGTPLVVRESAENQVSGNVGSKAKPAQSSDSAQ